MKLRPGSVIILPACILFMLSCKTNTQKDENELYYFPDKNVYYDTKTTSFYYSLDSARLWDSLVYNKPDVGSALGRKVGLKRSGRYAWSNNETHRKTYNATVLNVMNTRTIWMARADSIARIKPVVVIKPKPAVQEDTVVKEKPKRGIKKFFNNIFGKKKDKDRQPESKEKTE